MNASPQDGLIVTQQPSFLKPRESGTSPNPLTRARGSVRRASGSVQTGLLGSRGRMVGKPEVVPRSMSVLVSVCFWNSLRFAAAKYAKDVCGRNLMLSNSPTEALLF
jgi:hypothetical protein